MLFVVITPTEFALFEQRLACRAEHHGRYLGSWAKTRVVAAQEPLVLVRPPSRKVDFSRES